MALDEKRPCIWHAFNALDDKKKGSVLKSQLKVLSHNIASCLKKSKIEEALDDYRQSNDLSFLDYIYFLKVELFDSVSNEIEANNDSIDEVCWFVSQRKYLQRDPKILSDKSSYQLWRVFNKLCENEENGEVIYPVMMDYEEVILMVTKFLSFVGKEFEEDQYRETLESISQLSFEQVLNFFETRLCVGLEKDEVELGIKELNEEYVEEVIKKGYMIKKGHKIASWKERWFVLNLVGMRYFTSREEKDLKGVIQFAPHSKVESMPEKTGTRPNRFTVIGKDKPYEMSAPDLRTRSEWITAISSAIESYKKKASFQKSASLKRRVSRNSKRQKAKEEEMKRQEEAEKMKKTQEQLEAERLARAEAEAKLKQEAEEREAERLRRLQLDEEHLKEQEALKEKSQKEIEEERQRRAEAELLYQKEAQEKEAERKRREEIERQKALENEELIQKTQEQIEHERQEREKAQLQLEESAFLLETEKQRREELENLQKELQKLLEEERQAKRDEEIVRNLQSRMLEEEYQKREELEQLQIRQQEELNQEKQKRENLEELKQHQENMLQVEKEKLEELERNRKSMDASLQAALLKLEQAEKFKQAVETKMKEKEKPIGLARPIAPGENTKIITHRGEGAFTLHSLEVTKEYKTSNGVQPELASPTHCNAEK